MNKFQRIGVLAASVAVGIGGYASAQIAPPASQSKMWMETWSAEVVKGAFTIQASRTFEHVSCTPAAPGVQIGAAQVGDDLVEVETKQRLPKGSYITVACTFSK